MRRLFGLVALMSNRALRRILASKIGAIFWCAVRCRLCKDHLKNDLRSDQDHRQKIDLRSRSRSRF
jgi:hypothetical protein